MVFERDDMFSKNVEVQKSQELTSPEISKLEES